MERRSRIFPRELVHFPRKGLQNKTPSVLLPCPPHRISPLWEHSCKLKTEQVPHLSYQTRVIETSSVHTFFKDAERASSTQVLKRLTISSHVSHIDHKTMAVLLPCLHHRGLAKSFPRHRYHALATVMPFPRSNFRATKTTLRLTVDEQYLMPLPGHQNQPNCVLDTGYQFLDQSSPDHLPKIFPDYKNWTEAVTHLDQKALSPTTPSHKAEVPLCEGEKTRLGPICRPCLESQTEVTPGPLTTTQQNKTSLRHRRNQVRAATMLLGFTKKGDRPTASTSSYSLKDWSRGKGLKSPDLAKVLKKSHSDLYPRNTVSLVGCTNPESRSLTSSLVHHDQKTRVATVPNPGHQAEGIQDSTAQIILPMEVESWEEGTAPRTDDQATSVAGQDHEATPLLNQDSPEHWTIPTSVSEAKDLPDPNIHFTLQVEKDQQEQMNEETEHHAKIPASKHLETTCPPSVPQASSSDPWLKLTPSPPHQAEVTQCLFAHVSVQTDQGPITHTSVQTEQESWQMMSSRIDHQATAFISSDHGTIPPMDLNSEMICSGFNHHPTPTQSPDHQVTGNLVDTNPPVTLQTGQDHLGEMEQEIDLERAIFFTGQDHGPLDLDPQDKTMPDSEDTTTLIGQDSGAIPPMALDPQKKLQPEPDQQATSLINPHHLAKEMQGHLACVSVQKEHEPWEIMSKTDQHDTALIGQDCGTASFLDLDSKVTFQPNLDHQTTSPPSLDHQAENFSVLGTQLMLQKKILPWEEIALGTYHQTELLIDQDPEATPPFNLDPQDKSLPASGDLVITPSDQDHGITPPLTLGPQNKTLPEPDSLRPTLPTSPHHLNQAIQDHTLEISVQTNQEPPRRGQQARTVIGQDHGETTPLLVLDTRDTFSPSLDHQATFLPGFDHQTESIPDPNVQFTIQEKQDSFGEMAKKTHHQTSVLVHQSHGTIPPWNLDPQYETLSAPDPQTTTLRGQDHETALSFTLGPQNKTLFQLDQQVKDLQSHAAKVFIQTGQESWEIIPPKPDHQAMTLTDQDHGAILPMHLDPQDKSIPGPDHQQASTPIDQNYETTPLLNLGPQDKTLLEPENCIKPLPHPYQLSGDTQGQIFQASLQIKQEPQETTPALTNNQTTILNDQDHGTIPPLVFGPQNKILLEINQQLSTSPPPHHQAKDTPNHVAKILIQTEKEPFKTIPPRIDHQTTDLIVQDYEATPPASLDRKDVSPTDLDYWAISRHNFNQQDKIIIDHNAHVTPQEDLNPCETISQEKDLNYMNLIVEDFLDSPPFSPPFSGIDNQEKTKAVLDHWDICPPSPYCQVEDMQHPKVMVLPQSEQGHCESILQGTEPKAITLTSQAIPPLASDLQDQTLLPFDHQAIPQTNSEHPVEDIPDSDVHVCPQMVQEPLETPPIGKRLQAATPSQQDPEAAPLLGLEEDKIQPGLYHITCLSSPCHESEDTPPSNVHASTQTEQDPRETMTNGKDPQAKAQIDLDHEAIPLVALDQDEALTGPRLQAIVSPSPSKQAEDTQNAIANFSFQTDPEPWETFLPRMDNHTTTIKAQNNKAVFPVSLDFQNITLPDSNYQDTNMLSLDQQAGDKQGPTAHVLLGTEKECWETVLPRINQHQHTTLKGQGNGAIPLLSLDSQDKTLHGPCLQDASKFVPDQHMEPMQSSNAHVSFQTEPKSRETMPPRIAHQATNHMGQVNGSPSPLSSVSWNSNQSGSDHQAVIPPVNPNHKPEIFQDLQTYATAPSSNHHLPKLPMTFYHKAMSKSITNPKPRQSKQDPWCFKYIEPYTVNRTTIPTEIIHTIINSIPQERIKNDISKQILLRRMKASSTLRSDQQISSSYPVCLICASWIPDDCPHVQRMKSSCEAQLLVIPTPLPSPKGEDIGVKFVLQTPQTKHFTFTLPQMHYLSQMPSYHAAEPSPSSHLGSMRASMLLKHRTCIPSPIPERIKGLSFLIDKYHQPGQRSTFRSQQPLTSTKLMREYHNREGHPRAHPIFFRSLLERFQMKQKVN
ncbi:uncharacterized protein [Notamacropus eugenii]|uniref:uncharacterized protein n=1 Tax=Notamacropus eugenii TaxID=9315 RepID=UPI003B67ED49